MESTTQPNSSHMPSSSQETWRLECEAREWVRRFNQMKEESGLHAASGWWLATIKSIENKRGKKAADELRAEMNKIKCSS